MKKAVILVFIHLICVLFVKADRIYILSNNENIFGTPEIVNAIIQNGHSVTISNGTNLPLNFTSRCVDPVNGYDWLCLFAYKNYSNLTFNIKNYIDDGGKVFMLYDVYCEAVTKGTAFITSQILNNVILPDSNKSIAGNLINPNAGGWIAKNVNCCFDIKGWAYQGMSGIPIKNQLRATQTLPNGFPSINYCLNFGFVFATTDFPSASKKGGIIGIGDWNVFYDSILPHTTVNKKLIDFIFPNDSSTCYIFPSGCLTQWENNILNVSLGDDTILVCEGQKYLLEVGNPKAKFVWQDGSTADHFLVTKAGKYWVSGTLNGCTQSDTITVLYKPGPVANLGSDRALCKGESFTLDVSYPGATYLWQDSSSNAFFTVADTGTYWVKVNTSDCASSDSLVITKCIMPLIIPNVFTPNGDGVNDFFEIGNTEDWQVHLQIFNRWGLLVFESDTNQYWDGTYQGQHVSEGVYFYVIHATSRRSPVYRDYKGSITVMYD